MTATSTPKTASRKSWLGRVADAFARRAASRYPARMPRPHRRPTLECLGERSITSVSAALDPASGVLAVTGTDNLDFIIMSQADARISVSGVDGWFDAAQVKVVFVQAKGGNDLVMLAGASGTQPVRCPAIIDAGSGDDSVSGGDGTTGVLGGDGNDTVYAGDGSNLIRGGNGNDTLVGGNSFDLIAGDAGNDTIYGNNGSLWGFSFGSGGDANILLGGDGDDTIRGSLSVDLILGDAGQDMLDGDSGDDLVSGGAGNDLVKGNAGNDLLFGNDGFDTVYGGLGVDVLSGGSGADRLYGEGGTDVLLYDGYDCSLYGGGLYDTSDTYVGADTYPTLQAAIGLQYQLAGKAPDLLRDRYVSNYQLYGRFEVTDQDLKDANIGQDLIGSSTPTYSASSLQAAASGTSLSGVVATLGLAGVYV
jgi:Ca2+-binding RTX toxin-like protein